jgi:hypothetical protein
MLSIEEIKLLIEKLEKIKANDFQKLIDDNLKILKELAVAVDSNNQNEIDRLNKTRDWYAKDLEWRHERKEYLYDQLLFKKIELKIGHFAKMGARSALYNSLEIGPGYGRFSRLFLPWRLNFYVDILPQCKSKIEKLFHPEQHKYIRFYTTNRTSCPDIANHAVNFVFSWDTFTFFTQEHIKEYLRDIFRVVLPGGYAFIHYANCEYDLDLNEAKRGYWNYNTKSAMSKIIKETGYDIIEMDQFTPGANYAIFQKPGKDNPVLYKVLDIPAEK